ncbi:glycosyltransferase family 4 protein [Rhodoplanes roseus]|uniref:glycosyltransferase family 4 protein n=1 Tax=Rhodoplanes roseus TaxID=29409 RepID=UPI0011B53C07|nr:glycosyltransferase family 4 protein [Rhodoplanes roseus]
MSRQRGLRVLMTADAVGGVWTYATTLARALAERGHEIVLVTLGPAPTPAQRAALTGVAGVRLLVTDLALEWMDPEGRDLSRARDMLAGVADDIAPDIVHLGGYREATIPFAAPVLVVAHSCVRSWWRACRGAEPDEPRWTTYMDNVAAGLATATAWAAPTLAFRDTIAALYAPPSVGIVVPNGIDTQALAPARAPVPRRPVVLAAGRLWDEAKGLDTLLAAAPKIPWPVRLAGEAAAPDGRPAVSTSDTVTTLGPLDRPALLDEMRRSEVVVAPALYEPFGLGIAEAAASGAALVLSDLPSLRELWDGAALFVEPRDAAALATAVRGLCEDPARRTALQRAARDRAGRYTVAAMATRVEGLYDVLVAGAGRGAVISTAISAETVA